MTITIQIEMRVLSAILFIGFLYIDHNMSSLKYESNNRSNDQNNDDHPTKMELEQGLTPVIYTFYAPRLNEQGDVMDDLNNDEKLIYAWKTLWKEAGWTPRVLGLEDAKKHPDFIKYRDVLQTSEYFNLWDQSYGSVCFYRWLAMASHGSGGWMAEYDTFPMGITVTTGFNLPNNGRFTAYEMHIPSLLSGTAKEWERVSQLVLGQVENEMKNPVGTVQRNGYSDMMALKDIHDENGESVIFQEPLHVLSTYPYIMNNEDNSNIIDCPVLTRDNIWATHLSHFATEQAIDDSRLHTHDKETASYTRYNYAWELYFLWKYECAHNTTPIF